VREEHAANVFAAGPCLASKARPVGDVARRQLTAIDDLIAMKAGQRYLAGGDEIQIPVARDLEQIRLELGQMAGALQRGGVGHERRLDFTVRVLARVEIQHEVDQRAFQPGPGTAQDRKSRTGNSARALEIEDAERWTEVPMRLRCEIERRRLAAPPHFDVLPGTFPDR